MADIKYYDVILKPVLTEKSMNAMAEKKYTFLVHPEATKTQVKEAVENGRYRIDRNARRQDNINLFLDYVIDETKAKEIILNLTVMDFSEILQNEHKGFEHEKLYVFGKDVILLERNGTEEKTVSLYIKFNKLENCFVIVISFHEQKYPLTYYFK